LPLGFSGWVGGGGGVGFFFVFFFFLGLFCFFWGWWAGGGGGGGGCLGGGGGAHDSGKGSGGKGGPPPGVQRSRSIYVGNLPQGVTMAELSELAIPFGVLESLRWMGQAYAFLNFVDEERAVAFWEAGQPRGAGVYMRGVRLVLNWAKAPAHDPHVIKLVEGGATRHLRIGNISNQTTKTQMAELFKQFGEVESVRLLPGEGAALVNLTNVTNAHAAKEALDGLAMGGNVSGGAQWTLQVGFVQPRPMESQPRNTLM